MDQLSEHLKMLISDIKDSEAYRNYLTLENELLTHHPDLKREIDEFRAQNYRMQKNLVIDLYNEVDAFEKKFYELRKNPLVNAYLEAELEVCHMIQEIYTEIRNQINIGIPDIE